MVESNSISLKGVPASPGIVIGKAVVLDKDKLEIKATPIAENAIDKEIKDFKKATARISGDLQALSIAVAKRLGKDYARIFEAQAMIAADQIINQKVIDRIKREKIQAAYLYNQEISAVIEQLSQSDDPYLKERILDINSVCTRLLNVLQGVRQTAVKDVEGPTVVIAKYLSPGDLLGFSMRKRVGIAMEIGGVTSHTSLLAKSLDLPAIVGVGHILDNVHTGDRVIIDGYSGKLIIKPQQSEVKKFRKRVSFLKELAQTVARIKNKKAVTRDGHQVKIFNNIELPSESARVAKSGAEGIGLFRTEYLFLTDDAFPNSEKQFKAYKSILSKMSGKQVLIRTFDLGGDKFMADRLQTVDPNPFLGWRAIRFCLDNPELFKTQLKALLRASNFGNMGIMLPMISNLDELSATKKLIEECKQELTAERIKFKADIPLGIMIEVPSAVVLAEHLAREVDFFSIGTNDLVQYILAVDRTNEKLTHLYQSFNPAVLKMIKQTIDAGHKYNIKVGICGELSSDPLAAIVLVGMGIDELSTSYLATGVIKYVIRNIDLKIAKSIAAKVISMKTEADVIAHIKNQAGKHFPELCPLFDFMQGVNNGSAVTA